MNAPRYRADVKGQIAQIKADCVSAMHSEIQQSDDFIFTAEDCTHAWREYQDYLTAAELQQCFKKAR